MISFFQFTTLLIVALFSFLPNIAAAQNSSSNGFGIGFSAGQIYTNLGSSSGFFVEEVEPYVLNSNKNLSYQFHAVYDLSPYETVRFDVSTRKFSVATNYSGWPNLTFTNSLISSAISAELSILRYLGIQPYPFNVYGKFGFGLNLNSLSAVLNEDESDPISTNSNSNSNSSMYTAGAGLRIHITPGISLFTEYDLYHTNKNIIDSDFISDFIDTDFTQTSSRWSGLSAGIRINFYGKSSSYPNRRQTETIPAQPVHDLSSMFETVPYEEIVLLSSTDQSDLFEQLSTESHQRFQTYASISSPFTGNQNFLETVRSQNRYTNPIAEVPMPTGNYGTSGEWNADLEPGYTIVVHSLTSESDANRIAAELRDSGLRSMVLNAFINGRDYYRVVIGQYQARNEATSAANSLPDPLNSSFFVIPTP